MIACWPLSRLEIDQIDQIDKKSWNAIAFPSSKVKDYPFANVLQVQFETMIFLGESLLGSLLTDEDSGFELAVFHHLEMILSFSEELDHSQSQSSTSGPDTLSQKLPLLEHH